jgi:hypothetical protein
MRISSSATMLSDILSIVFRGTEVDNPNWMDITVHQALWIKGKTLDPDGPQGAGPSTCSRICQGAGKLREVSNRPSRRDGFCEKIGKIQAT